MRGFEWADVVIAGGMFVVLVVLVLVLQRGEGLGPAEPPEPDEPKDFTSLTTQNGTTA